MENEIEVAQTSEFKHQFAKVVLATVGGFLLGKLIEKSYDRALTKFNTPTADPQQ